MASVDINFLKSINILKGLSDEQLVKFSKIMTLKKFKKTEYIMKEGEVGNTMYLFKEGTVEVVQSLTLKFQGESSEAEKSMIKLKAGIASVFGEMSIISNDTRSASIKADEECTLYEIHRNDFDKICQEDPDLGYKVFKKIGEVLCQRIKKSNKDILKLTTILSMTVASKKKK